MLCSLSKFSYTAIACSIYLVCAGCAKETNQRERDARRLDGSVLVDAQSRDSATGGGAGASAGSSGRKGAVDSGSAGASGKTDSVSTRGSGGSGQDAGGFPGTGGSVDSGSPGSADSGYPKTSERECTSLDDCHLVDDCCHCLPRAMTTSSVPRCDTATCAQTACAAQAITGVTCAMGRCALDIGCNRNLVKCDSLPPDCPTGKVPAVSPSSSCWTGSCVAPDQCASVTSCEDCLPEQVCVFDGNMAGLYHCVYPPAKCLYDRTCACMGADVCFMACSDYDGQLSCYCPVC